MDNYKRVDVDDSTIEITVTIPGDIFTQSYNTILKDHASKSEKKGFRKGQVPTEVVEKELGSALMLDTLERLAPMYINNVLVKEEISPAAPPSFKDLPKLEKDTDVEFTVVVTVMPKFKLGNLKKVKLEKIDAKVEDKEIDDAIEDIRKNYTPDVKKVDDKWVVEIVKKLELEKGIKDLDGLKKFIGDALGKQKEHMMWHKQEEDALAQGIKLSNIVIPKAAIEFEARERENSFMQEMGQRGLDLDEFLKKNNIDMVKMRELWEKDAREALEADTFLGIYSQERDIKVSDEDLEKKIKSIKASQPDADESVFENEEWREYIRRVEQKEKGFGEFIKEVLGEDPFKDEHK